jgi:FtsH-binding integral membrane protein
MQKLNLSSLSLQELEQREKAMKTSLSVFAGLLIVLLLALVFMFLKIKTTSVAAVPFIIFVLLVALLMFNKKTLTDIQKKNKGKGKETE